MDITDKERDYRQRIKELYNILFRGNTSANYSFTSEDLKYIQQEARGWAIQTPHTRKPQPYVPESHNAQWLKEQARRTGKLKILTDGFLKSRYKYSAVPDIYKQFPVYQGPTDAQSLRNAGMLPRLLTSLDVESSDTNKVLSIGAARFAVDAGTGRLFYVDNYQRYYNAVKLSDLRNTYAVHGLTQRGLSRLRAQQLRAGGTPYHRSYTPAEEKHLRDYIGNSAITGHNIVRFDIPLLFQKGTLDNPIIDTMIMSINTYGDHDISGHPLYHNLEDVFKRLYGKTIKQAGYQHHSSAEDVGIEAKVFQKLMGKGGQVPQAIKQAMVHGYSLIEKQVYQPRNGPEEVVMLSHRGDLGYLENISMQLSSEDLKNLRSKGLAERTKSGDIVPIEGMDLNSDVATASLDSAIMSAKIISQEINRTLGDTFKAFREQQSIQAEAWRAMSASANATALSSAARAYAKGNWNVRDIKSHLLFQGFDENRVDKYVESVQKEAALINKGATDAARSTFIRQFGTSSGFYPGDKATVEEYKNAGWAAGFAHKQEQALRKLGYIDSAGRDVPGARADEARFMIRGSQSITELSDALEELTQQAKEARDAIDQQAAAWHNATAYLHAASPGIYDPTKLNEAFLGQMGGVAGSFGRLFPGTKRIVTSFADATVHSYRARFAYANEGISFLKDTGNALMGLAMPLAAANPIVGTAMAGAGFTAGWGSQLVGHSIHGKIIRGGEQLQAALDTANTIKEVALLPLRAFQSAIQTTTKLLAAFGGIAFGVGRSLSGLSAMGNPLTGMTGITYGDYVGNTIIDRTANLAAGTMNSVYNDFASQRVALYTTGRLDSNRMVAASMLGVFSNVYGGTGTEKENLANAINSLSSRLTNADEFTRKQTYALANMVSPSMGNILQTMHTLGLSTYEQFLAGPGNITRTSPGGIEAYRGRFTRAGWEYQTVNNEWQFQSRRIATSLWGTVGRPLANFGSIALGGLADILEGKPGALESFKKRVVVAWDDISKGVGKVKEAFGLDKNTKMVDLVKNGVWDLVKAGLEIIKDAIPMFGKAWDMLLDVAAVKMQGFIDFISTASVDIKQLQKILTGGTATGPLVTFLNKKVPFKDQSKEWQERIVDHWYDKLKDVMPTDAMQTIVGKIGGSSKLSFKGSRAAMYAAMLEHITKVPELWDKFAAENNIHIKPRQPGESIDEFGMRLPWINTQQLADLFKYDTNKDLINSTAMAFIDSLINLGNNGLGIKVRLDLEDKNGKSLVSVDTGSGDTSGFFRNYEGKLGNFYTRASIAVN